MVAYDVTPNEVPHPSRFRRSLLKLARNPAGLLGSLLVVLTLLVAVFGSQWAPYNPSAMDLSLHLLPPAWLAGGSPHHLLGTDYLGRDEWSRILVATRASVLVSFAGMLISIVLGTLIGLFSGYFGGFAGNVLMRMTDVQMAFPFILMALTIMATSGPGTVKLVIVLGLSGWTAYARIIRGEVLGLRERVFVESARAIGCTHSRIIFRHILPNVVGTLVVIATMNVAVNILLEAGLTFLGLGLNPSIPSWGAMLADGRNYIQTAWWLSTFPGVAILIAVMGFNLLGDWLRDVSDPTLRG